MFRVIRSALQSTYRMPVKASSVTKRFNASTLEEYGQHLFKGVVAEPYLKDAGLPANTLDSANWTTDGNADKVASAILKWALDNGATSYCHWFQPLASAGFRHGQSAQVQNKFFEFDRSNQLVFDFKGKNLLKGETDGSSYQNGGLRATHRAGGYLAIDTSSPVFLRGDTVFIPAALVSFLGHALDEKTPLLRASDALSNEGVRLLKNLGYNVNKVFANIGLEQELFFVPRDQYLKRVDLQFSGRTVLGKLPSRGQELCDHYMAPPSLSSPALACMQQIQDECFKMGIPLKTRHREVAPNQYEFAPMFGTVTTQIDQNLMVMQIIDEVSVQHGLAAVLHEKPFQGVNGSGKHNNWSIGTDDGTNLLNFSQLADKAGSNEIFPVIMAAIIEAVDRYGDLMRLAIAVPGNDFRLGACEAPPAIISTYLGDNLTSFLDAYRKGSAASYNPITRKVNLGSSAIASIEMPSEDRNRTSPFPYGGHRFEFRAVGSSQNVSFVNTVLASMTAKVFKEFSQQIEAGKKPKDIAVASLNQHWKVIFNGNGYDPANQQDLTERDCWRIDSCVDAITKITEPKNVELFEELNVLSSEECEARQKVLLNHYIGVVEVEVSVCLILVYVNVIIVS